MKSSKILLIIAGIIAIIAITVAVTLGVQRSIHHRKFIRKVPHLAKLMGDKKPKDLLVTIKTVRAIETLDLNDEQSARYISLSRKLETLRKEHHEKRKEKLEELDRLVKAAASDDELQKAIKELQQLEEDFRTETKGLRDEINSILTPDQQARLILFEKEFQREMQEFLEGQPRRKRCLKGKDIESRRSQKSSIGQHGKEAIV